MKPNQLHIKKDPVAKSHVHWEILLITTNLDLMNNIHLFFYKQSIFDPCPKNYLIFSKKLPQRIA